MDNLFSYWQNFLLPPGEVALALLVGGLVVKSSTKSKNSIRWSIGSSLICASVASAVALIWFYVYMRQVTGWGGLLYFYTPFIPLCITGAGSILIFSGLIVWGGRKKGFFDRKGYAVKPGKVLINIAGAVLAVGLIAVVYALLPIIQLFPYRDISYGARNTNNPQNGPTSFEQTLTVTGTSYVTDKRENILVLHNGNWPEYDPSFRLQLDWRGRIELRIRHVDMVTNSEETHSYYLPFEPSKYYLRDGKPVRVE